GSGADLVGGKSVRPRMRRGTPSCLRPSIFAAGVPHRGTGVPARGTALNAQPLLPYRGETPPRSRSMHSTPPAAGGGAGVAIHAKRPGDWLGEAPARPRKRSARAGRRRRGGDRRAHGQYRPVGAGPDGTVIYGGRQLRAARLVGMSELEVQIYDG